VANYAILVAITDYPGLRNLEGPENDVGDFQQWLVATDGGNLKPDNVKIIKSSDFPKVTDPGQANPTEVAFKEALKKLLFNEDGSFKGHAGERLYLFFAGHGFAGRRLSEAALYTANATRNDCVHIASKRYVERIASSRAFDEVVLLMDCCRDVDLSDSIQEPVLKLPDRAQIDGAASVFEAYAAGRGQQARERSITPGGPSRGLFTYAFVDALRNARGDDEGNVTGTLVKGHILDNWPKLFTGTVPYWPDIYPPGGADIVFVKGRVPPAVKVSFIINPPQPQAGTMIVIQNPPGTEVKRVAFNPAGTETSLPDGIYKALLNTTTRSAYIDAAGSSVEVSL